MKMTNKLLVAGLLALAVGMTACSSSEDNPTATTADDTTAGTSVVTFSLSANTSFSATSGRSVDEDYYSTLSNYTVELEEYGEILYEWTGEDMPSSLELTNGAYTLLAYCGEDEAASTESMYVYGETVFNINSSDESVSVSCLPVCAKVTVNFDESMDTYFSDYSMTFSTSALGSDTWTWEADETGPVYLKVDDDESVAATINMTHIETGATSAKDLTLTLSPAVSQTVNVSTQEYSGDITGITITIDTETTEETIEIDIPSEWK